MTTAKKQRIFIVDPESDLIALAEKLSDPQRQAEAITAEHKRNLGYGLYKALQNHGGWRVNA